LNSLRNAILVTIFIFTTTTLLAGEANFEATKKDSSSANTVSQSLIDINKKEKLKELELLAENFTNNGFYSRAINVYDNILKQKLPKKKLFEYYVKIGDLHNLNKNYVYSLTSYQKALRIRKKSSQIFVKIGNIFLEERLFILAKKAFAQALEINKRSIEAIIGKGNVFYIQSNYAKALQYYNKIPKEFYDREIVKKAADCYINLKRNNEAVTILESFLKEHHADYELIFDLAMIYTNRRDYNMAENLFSKILKADTNNFKACVYLGTIYDLKGEGNKALKMFNKAYTINSSYAIVDFMRAKSAYNMGRINEAKIYANEAYNKTQNTFIKDQTQKFIKYLNSK
jgi:tetratricopeptide (TPR) repeat protein